MQEAEEAYHHIGEEDIVEEAHHYCEGVVVVVEEEAFHRCGGVVVVEAFHRCGGDAVAVVEEEACSSSCPEFAGLDRVRERRGLETSDLDDLHF